MGFQLFTQIFLLTLCDRITVRQTVDPYVDDIQYIASREVPLERDGSLSMSKIGLGMPGDKFIVRRKFYLGHMCLAIECLQIISREAEIPIELESPVISIVCPISDIVEPYFVHTMASRKDGPHPILTVVGKTRSSPHSLKSFRFFCAESRDNDSGSKRHQRRIDARDRDEQLAYLKGLVTHAWNWVAPVFPSVPFGQVTSMGSQRQRLDSISTIPEDLQPGNAGSVSTCVADRGNTSRLVHRHQTASDNDSDLPPI